VGCSLTYLEEGITIVDPTISILIKIFKEKKAEKDNNFLREIQEQCRKNVALMFPVPFPLQYLAMLMALTNVPLFNIKDLRKH
jgi:hypothetical protein